MKQAVPRRLRRAAPLLLLPLAAPAQNIAIVNGKPVPKARVDALVAAGRASGGQQQPPELEQRARDEVVLREIFVQEAEKRGLAAIADYKAQMELARQSILIRELFEDYQKKNPVTDAEAQGRVRQVQGAGHAAPNTARATSWSRRKTKRRS